MAQGLAKYLNVEERPVRIVVAPVYKYRAISIIDLTLLWSEKMSVANDPKIEISVKTRESSSTAPDKEEYRTRPKTIACRDRRVDELLVGLRY